jgi:hypothetical protein
MRHFRFNFTDSQLERNQMKAQCVERHLRYMRDHNTGLQDSWTELQCAQMAADESYDKVKAGSTIVRYYKEEYVLLEGFFLADARGSYVRDTWVSAFLAQHDLVFTLNSMIKANLKRMSLAKVFAQRHTRAIPRASRLTPVRPKVRFRGSEKRVGFVSSSIALV